MKNKMLLYGKMFPQGWKGEGRGGGDLGYGWGIRMAMACVVDTWGVGLQRPPTIRPYPQNPYHLQTHTSSS